MHSANPFFSLTSGAERQMDRDYKDYRWDSLAQVFYVQRSGSTFT